MLPICAFDTGAIKSCYVAAGTGPVDHSSGGYAPFGGIVEAYRVSNPQPEAVWALGCIAPSATASRLQDIQGQQPI
jgi:hypothetical protein